MKLKRFWNEIVAYFLWGPLEVQVRGPGGQIKALVWTGTSAKPRRPRQPRLSCYITLYCKATPPSCHSGRGLWNVFRNTCLGIFKSAAAAPSCCSSHSHLQSDTTIPLCRQARWVKSRYRSMNKCQVIYALFKVDQRLFWEISIVWLGFSLLTWKITL